MKLAKAFGALIATFITVPIWMLLLYRILETINASELTWFLYWIYMPAAFLGTLILSLTRE